MEKGNSAKFVKIVILVAFLLGLSTYITFYLTKTHYEGKGNNSGTEEKATKQEETVEDITNQELAESLFNDIHNYEIEDGLRFSTTDCLYGKQIYDADFLTNSVLKVSDMDYDKLLSIAYNVTRRKNPKQLEEKAIKKQDTDGMVDVKVYTIDASLVEKTFKQLFGNNKSYIAKTVKDEYTENINVAYSDSSIYYENGKYVTYEVRGFGGEREELFEEIFKATKSNSKIEIFTSVGYGGLYEEHEGKLYKDNDCKELVGELKNFNPDNHIKQILDYIKTNSSKFHNYKYTFNKEADGNYSFYSVEKVQ